MAAQTGKACAVSIQRAGAPQAARSSEKPASQNNHPNLPMPCRHLQLQVNVLVFNVPEGQVREA